MFEIHFFLPTIKGKNPFFCQLITVQIRIACFSCALTSTIRCCFFENRSSILEMSFLADHASSVTRGYQLPFPCPDHQILFFFFFNFVCMFLTNSSLNELAKILFIFFEFLNMKIFFDLFKKNCVFVC